MRRGIALLLALSLATPTLAAEPSAAELDQARAYFDAGRQAYDRGDFPTSIKAFEAAEQIARRPSITFSLAQSYRRVYVVDRSPATLRRAVELYRRYLGEMPEGGRRADAQQLLADLELLLLKVDSAPAAAPASVAPEPTQLMVTSQVPQARGSIDGGAVGEMPLVASVAPGRHAVHVEAAGHFPADAEGMAVEGKLVVVPVALREQPARVTLNAPDGAEVQVDGLPVGEMPLLSPLDLPAGPHHVGMGITGHVADLRAVELPPGSQLALDAQLPMTLQRKIAWGVIAGSGGLFVASGTLAGLAIRQQNDASRLLGLRDQDRQNLSTSEVGRYNRARDARDIDRAWATGLGVSAAVCLLFGAGLYLLDSPDFAVTPTVMPPQNLPKPAESGAF